jgi:hypothetical protein
MEKYEESPLWKAAFALSRSVDKLTRDFPEYNTLVRFMREKAAALPLAVADVYAHTPAHANALKRAYEQAHDAEYVLFCSLLFHYLPHPDANKLFTTLGEIKRLIVAELAQP